MRVKGRFALGVLTGVAIAGRMLAGQTLDRRQLERVEETLRQEGQAVVELADAAVQGARVSVDFPLGWHNDFLKAQSGTFIPFVVSIGPAPFRTSAALLYVRASRRAPGDRPPPKRGAPAVYPVEEIYPVDLPHVAQQAVHVTKGVSLAPGDYDITVVVRERERPHERGRPLVSAVLRRSLNVPDFSGPELTTSTVILADRLTVLADPLRTDELSEHPYVIAGREIQPVLDRVFSRSGELIVVFLIYNPLLTEEKHFDLEVEYHFFKRTGTEEAYVNRTEPQRFNPITLGPEYDPSAGQPVLAGQGVPLAPFEAGEYRLSIKVTDLVASRSVLREVTFSIRS